MADNKNNNIDRELMQSFGASLSGDKDQKAIEDPLLGILMKYRTQEKEHRLAYNTGKEEAWKNLQEELNKDKKGSIYILDAAKGSWKWAAAAVLTIAALSAYWLLQLQGPELIHQSYASIETVTLKDGSEVTLRPYSQIYELAYTSSQQEYKLDGEAYFKVDAEQKRSFTVSTSEGKVTVLGTTFILSNWGGTTRAFLEEGSLQVESLENEDRIILEPGEAAEITAQNKELQVQPNANIQRYNDWMENRLVFENDPLSTVAEELEQHFNIQIEIPEGLSQTEISGGLNLETAEQSLNYLSLTLDGNFEKMGENAYRLKPDSSQE